MKIKQYQVKFTKYTLIISELGEKALIHMGYDKHIKDLKSRIKYAINNNEDNRNGSLTTYHFISSYLDVNSYKLMRLPNNVFVFKALDEEIML